MGTDLARCLLSLLHVDTFPCCVCCCWPGRAGMPVSQSYAPPLPCASALPSPSFRKRARLLSCRPLCPHSQALPSLPAASPLPKHELLPSTLLPTTVAASLLPPSPCYLPFCFTTPPCCMLALPPTWYAAFLPAFTWPLAIVLAAAPPFTAYPRCACLPCLLFPTTALLLPCPCGTSPSPLAYR